MQHVNVRQKMLTDGMHCPNCGNGIIYPGAVICGICGIPIINSDIHPEKQIRRLSIKIFSSPLTCQLLRLELTGTGAYIDFLPDVPDVNVTELIDKRLVIYQGIEDKPAHLCPIIYYGIVNEAVNTVDRDGPAIHICSYDTGWR